MAADKSSQPDHRKQGQSPDPYLRNFLRQAVAIISAERGINDASYAKLQVIAKQLGLSQSTFDSAIDKLKQPDSGLGLNRYEKQFVRFLSDEFEKISGDVLTVQAEAKAIDLAESKYQIDSVRAHQLLYKTATQCSVSLISHLDAEQFALNLIDDAAAQNKPLDTQNLNRLFRACSKWGFSENDVEIALKARLARNRRESRKSAFTFASIVVGLVGLTGCLIYGIAQINWQNYVFGDKATETILPVAVDSENLYPVWWDVELYSIAEELRNLDPQTNRLIQEIVQTNSGDRDSPYGRLTIRSFEQQPSAALLNKFLSRLYLQDPDDTSAESIVSQINELLLFDVSRPVATAGRIRRSLTANQLLGIIVTDRSSQAVPGRRERAGEIVSKAFGIQTFPTSLEAYEQVTEPKLTVNQWLHASIHSRTEPEKVAAFLPQLETRAASRNDLGINELRTAVLHNIIAARPFLWKSLRESVAISIRNADAQKTVSWIDLLFDSVDRSLNEFLITRLAAHLSLETSNKNHSTIVNELKQYRTDYVFRGLQPAMQAKDRLEIDGQRVIDQLVKKGMKPDSVDTSSIKQRDLPELIAAVARNNNMAIALAQSIENGNGYSQLDFSAFEIENEFSVPGSLQPRSIKTPTPSERRSLNESFDTIFNSESNRVTARMSALQSLARTATGFPDIDYSTAENYAAYLFKQKEPREQLAVERVLAKFSHWTQLKLAIGDQIDDESVELDSLLNILNRLGMRNVLLGQDSDWRQQIQREILNEVALQLRYRQQQQIDHKSWEHLEETLKDIYSVRVEIVGRKTGRLTRETLSHSLIDAIQHWLTNSPHAGRKRCIRSLEWIRSADEHELAKLALVNQVLAEIISGWGHEPMDLSSNRFAVVLKQTAHNNGQRLLLSELMLMEVLKSYRCNWEKTTTQ